MSDQLFLSSDELSSLVTILGQCVGAGVGIGSMFWALSAAFKFLYDFVRL